MAEGDRTFLGLTHNPFVEPYRGFFERGGRKTHLEKLRHLSEWSRRVLLVTGPEGVGKTTLYRELAATLEPRVKAARISASLVNAGREVLTAIAQGFGIAVRPGANVQSLHADIAEHVEAQAQADRPCLVLVDDAQFLDNKAVEELMALAQETVLHLVLFGEVRMVPVVERAASSRGIGWQEIRLTGYGEADARDYLEWRFSQARYRGRIPFTDSQVKDLVKFSSGLPGRINHMANVLLVKLETGEASPRRGRFPRRHAALLGLLLILLGLFYVLFTAEEPAHETIAIDLPQPLPQAAEPEQEVEDLDAAGEATTALPVAAETIEPPHEADSTVLPGTVTPEPEVVDEAPGLDPAGGEQPALAGTMPAADVAGEAAPAEAEPASVSEPSALGAPPIPATEAPETVAIEAQVEDAAAAELAEAEAAPVTAPSTAAPLASGARDTRWLLRQNPDYFTVQLVTVSALDRAEAFVARQREPAEFAIYQLQRDGRVLHVVLYGLFSSRAAAQAAADDLPAEVGDVRPWIRPVGQIQSAARLSTQN